MKIDFKDNASPLLDQIDKALIPSGTKELMRDAAKGVAVLLRKKLRKNGNIANRLNAPSTHWWKAASESIELTSDTNTATIYAKKRGLNAHYYGATIKPTEAKGLAIPINPAYHGRTPREFPKGTFFRFTSKKGNDILAVNNPDGTFNPAYVLRKQTIVPKNRELFPSKEDIEKSLAESVSKHLNKEIK